MLNPYINEYFLSYGHFRHIAINDIISISSDIKNCMLRLKQYPSYTSNRHFCVLFKFRQITRPEVRCFGINSSSLYVDDCLQTMHNLKPLYFITSALKVHIHCIDRQGTSLLQDNCHFHLFRGVEVYHIL